MKTNQTLLKIKEMKKIMMIVAGLAIGLVINGIAQEHMETDVRELKAVAYSVYTLDTMEVVKGAATNGLYCNRTYSKKRLTR